MIIHILTKESIQTIRQLFPNRGCIKTPIELICIHRTTAERSYNVKLLKSNLTAAITGHVNCMERLRKSVTHYTGSMFIDRPDSNVIIDNLRHISSYNGTHDEIPDIDHDLSDSSIFPSFVELYTALERGDIDLISISGVDGLPIIRANYYTTSGGGDDTILLYGIDGYGIQLVWGCSASREVNGFSLPIDRFISSPNNRTRDSGTRLLYGSIDEWLVELFSEQYRDTIDIDLSDVLNPENNRVTVKGIVNRGNANEHYYLSKDGNIHLTDSFTDKQETVKVTTNTSEQTKQETSVMKSTNNLVSNILAANKGAAVNAVEMEAGRAINARITAVFGDKIKLPMGMGGMLKTPVGQVVLANLFAVLVKQYLPENALANRAADGAVKSAAYEVLRDIDISGMIAEVFEGVKVSGVAVNSADRPAEINLD